MRRDELYLLDMLDAAGAIRDFTQGKSFDDFCENYLLQVGIWKLFEIIGEAARKVSAQFKDDHPEIPWRSVRGMRHNLVHEYFRIDLKQVWAAVEEDIPPLIEQLEPLVPPKPDQT
mgnify:CR=1 FL=1